MVRHKASLKDNRKSKKANIRNRMARSTLTTAIRKVLAAGKKAEAETALRAAVSVIDKSVGGKLINRNNAARKKSRLYRVVSALAQ